MKPEALQQARDRLERAKANAAILADPSRTMGELSVAWSNFILAANGVYAKLEQGAKGNNKSDPWFGRHKHLRKTDPLLSYLHAARNSDEHTLELISGVGIEGKSFQDGITVSSTRIGRQVSVTIHAETPPVPGRKVVDLSFGYYPQPVSDRFKKRFDPPDNHLGQPITDRTTGGMAALSLKYLENMVAEANALLTA